jgi:hypothetical protein
VWVNPVPNPTLVALLIKIESRGPILFRQHWFGFNNDTFEVSNSGQWPPTGRTSPTCRRRLAATGA